MTPEEMLNNLIHIAGGSQDQKILLELPYSNDTAENKSILITVSGNITFFQLNETFRVDGDEYCSEHYPITADHVLDLIKAYDTAVYQFITDKEHTFAAKTPVMDHREYSLLERIINTRLDSAYQIGCMVQNGDKPIAYLNNLFRYLGSIREDLEMHRVKDPSQELKPITHLMRLINKLSQDAKS